MVFDRARRIGRVFAVALLVWTAVDVFDYGTCANHRDPLPACVSGSMSVAAPAGPACPAGRHHDHAADCFCCSPYVDVQSPFEVSVSYAVAWALAPEPVDHPLLGASPVYHPPLA